MCLIFNKIQDLFISLRIKDSSLVGQHDGTWILVILSRWYFVLNESKLFINFLTLQILRLRTKSPYDRTSYEIHTSKYRNRALWKSLSGSQICEPGYWDTKSHERKSSLEIESPDTPVKATDPIPKTIERDAIVIFVSSHIRRKSQTMVSPPDSGQ